MNSLVRRRAAALLEVLGVYLTGAFLNDKIVQVLVDHRMMSSQSPFGLLTTHATNAELLLASRQLFLALVLIYGSFALLVVPIDWLRRRRGAAVYGLTRAGLSVRSLVFAGLATACLVEWPVLIHTVVDAIHPLGAMAPWRQAFFDMSWHRWQFWLFAGVLSYAVIPVVEELLFRGYYQRRLAEDWGNGPAIIGVACLFTLSHKQYLMANLYNVTMIVSLFCLAVGLGMVFAWTRSLLPSMIAHSIINIPMTPRWQAALLVVFVVGILFALRGGLKAARGVFGKMGPVAAVALPVILGTYVVAANQIPSAMTVLAFGLLLIALGLEAADRQRNRSVQADSFTP